MVCYTISGNVYEADTPGDAAERYFTAYADRQYGEDYVHCEYLTLTSLASTKKPLTQGLTLSYTYSAVMLRSTEESPYSGFKSLGSLTCVVEEVREDLLLDHPSLDSFFPRDQLRPLLEGYRVADVTFKITPP